MVNRNAIPGRPLELTEAGQPAGGWDAGKLTEGYRLGTYLGRKDISIPMLSAAVGRERLFDVFLSLLAPLGEIVDVILETSHDCRGDRHHDLRRTHIDRPVLESYVCEFEDLLTNDGCTGIAVIAPDRPMEVQFDEHKVLTCYAVDLRPFRRVLRAAGIPRSQSMRLISEAAHLHHTRREYAQQFDDFAMRLGVGESLQPVTG